MTPYSLGATEAFEMIFNGGKQDDITIVVALLWVSLFLLTLSIGLPFWSMVPFDLVFNGGKQDDINIVVALLWVSAVRCCLSIIESTDSFSTSKPL